MNNPTIQCLYDALLDEMYSFFLKEGNESMEEFLKKPNTSKIDIAITIISGATVDKELKYYQTSLVNYLADIKILIANDIINFDINLENYFKFYGLLCALFCIFKKGDESIFKSFNIGLFPRLSCVINNYTNVNQLEAYYLNKFECFNKDMVKSSSNLYQRWFKLMCDNNLDYIPTIENKKKKKKKSKDEIKKELTNKIQSEEEKIQHGYSKVDNKSSKGNGNSYDEIETSISLNGENQQNNKAENISINEEEKYQNEIKDESHTDDNRTY